MMKMNNKFLKYLLSILIFFFVFTMSASAAKVKYAEPYSSAVQSHPYKLKGQDEVKYVAAIGVFSIDGAHAFCIEPGVDVVNGQASSSKKTLADYNVGKFTTEEKKKMLSYILSYSTEITNTSKYSGKQKFDTLPAEVQKSFAAQALVWEVAVGERTSFNQVKPQVGNGFSKDKSLYEQISSITGSHAGIYTEYKSLISKIHAIFETSPKGFFASQADANKKPLILTYYNSGVTACSKTGGEGWVGKLTTDATTASNWKVTQPNGVTVKISGTEVQITACEEKQASVIELTNILPSGRSTTGPQAFVFTGQDVSTIGGIPKKNYLTVSTQEKPNYQLSVTKYETNTTNPIEGVSFYVCPPSSKGNCNNSTKIATITTNASGVAKISTLDQTGDYYVKEVSAPKGYDADTSVHKVKVTTSNVDTPANITIYNAPIIVDLIKYTVDEDGNKVELDDDCGGEEEGTYTSPVFSIKDKNGKLVCLIDNKDGSYTYTTDCDEGTTEVKTCKGEFNVSKLPECEYDITEIELPKTEDGNELSGKKDVPERHNICNKNDRAITFVNGFSGLEFQKKDEHGNLLPGGKFALQRKENGVYTEVGLVGEDGVYTYSSNKTSENVTYEFETNEGSALIKGLGAGEYRVVEKEAPEGYELIADKDSKAKVTISQDETDEYYKVVMVDRKTSTKGSESSAELIVTITTGRKVLNYALIFGGLGILLAIIIIIRKKFKK